ncbi:uncharacterized protein LOC124418971 [Lucilia cuprina]|uniref:uncharacterized protein LOC124418971 n=1 Tax=Lucilia cuprina TaxID=7375 RepID=UPI001F05EF22|nr:uncharacterized protein LOC124418971 [Lucilia cuprina]
MCKKLQNGTILIKAKNYTQASKLIQLTSLSSEIQVELKEHPTLNFSRGVIYSNDLRDIAEEEILSELKSQNVCSIKKIMKKVDEVLQETGLIIITFAATTLPSDLYVGYEKLKIRPYIPLPLKCNKCFQYGHISKICKNDNICYNCAQAYHLNPELKEKCTLPPQCTNCKNLNYENCNHPSVSRTCPVFLKEKEIQAITTIEKVSKKQAIKTYQQRHNNPTTTYSSVVISNNKSSENISPNSQTRPIRKYEDIASEDTTDQSDIDKQNTSKKKNSPSKNSIILPKTTSKRTRSQVKKQLEELLNSKRTKN